MWLLPDEAATDDESQESGGGAATGMSATAPSGEACAEAAGGEGTPRRKSSKVVKAKGGNVTPIVGASRGATHGPGTELPKDSAAFVRAVNEKIDLVQLMVELLRGNDDKLAGRLVEQLVEMAYEKNSAGVEDPMKGYVGIARPERD